jgi:hypothetical protein
MSYASTVRSFAEAHARRQVFGTSLPVWAQSYGQTAQKFGKGSVAFRNAIDKQIPVFIAKFEANKFEDLIATLEANGYIVTKAE